jgi:hypothetical protein
MTGGLAGAGWGAGPLAAARGSSDGVASARHATSAEAHRRSLNSEAIVCLECVLIPGRVAASERLARARARRSALPKGTFRAKDIDAHKRQRRP